MKTNHCLNKITFHSVTIIPTFHSVTIIPMTSFTAKSTSKLKSFLHFRYSIVIPISFLTLIRLNYDNGFHNTLDYNHSIYRDYLLCTVTASAHIML